MGIGQVFTHLHINKYNIPLHSTSNGYNKCTENNNNNNNNNESGISNMALNA